MKIGSDCSGSCNDCLINYSGGCIAGHGDDYFIQITEERVKMLLKERQLKNYADTWRKLYNEQIAHKNNNKTNDG